jgi:hypothetical protein
MCTGFISFRIGLSNRLLGKLQRILKPCESFKFLDNNSVCSKSNDTLNIFEINMAFRIVVLLLNNSILSDVSDYRLNYMQ